MSGHDPTTSLPDDADWIDIARRWRHLLAESGVDVDGIVTRQWVVAGERGLAGLHRPIGSWRHVEICGRFDVLGWQPDAMVRGVDGDRTYPFVPVGAVEAATIVAQAAEHGTLGLSLLAAVFIGMSHLAIAEESEKGSQWRRAGGLALDRLSAEGYQTRVDARRNRHLPLHMISPEETVGIDLDQAIALYVEEHRHVLSRRRIVVYEPVKGDKETGYSPITREQAAAKEGVEPFRQARAKAGAMRVARTSPWRTGRISDLRREVADHITAAASEIGIDIEDVGVVSARATLRRMNVLDVVLERETTSAETAGGAAQIAFQLNVARRTQTGGPDLRAWMREAVESNLAERDLVAHNLDPRHLRPASVRMDGLTAHLLAAAGLVPEETFELVRTDDGVECRVYDERTLEPYGPNAVLSYDGGCVMLEGWRQACPVNGGITIRRHGNGHKATIHRDTCADLGVELADVLHGSVLDGLGGVGVIETGQTSHGYFLRVRANVVDVPMGRGRTRPPLRRNDEDGNPKPRKKAMRPTRTPRKAMVEIRDVDETLLGRAVEETGRTAALLADVFTPAPEPERPVEGPVVDLRFLRGLKPEEAQEQLLRRGLTNEDSAALVNAAAVAMCGHPLLADYGEGPMVDERVLEMIKEGMEG